MFGRLKRVKETQVLILDVLNYILERLDGLMATEQDLETKLAKAT